MGTTAVAVPEVGEEIREGDEVRDEVPPLYQVILLDDDDHSYDLRHRDAHQDLRFQ